MGIPKYDELFNPVLKAMHELGGSARIDEIDNKVADILKLSDKEVDTIHRGNTTVLQYRDAWARNYLKRYGLLENTGRGLWALTSEGLNTEHIDPNHLKRTVSVRRGPNLKNDIASRAPEIDDELEENNDWRQILLQTVKNIEPAAFERLCQRILRESGFTEVAVEGRSGDGGIDGRGIYKINGLISMRVIFQSKRYSASISSQQIREFKGTMAGRAEKGIFITTGSFTRDAKREAIRDGSVPLDLIDGELLVELMKDLGLGCRVEVTERVIIDDDWLKSI